MTYREGSLRDMNPEVQIARNAGLTDQPFPAKAKAGPRPDS
jgi:hypothetical protein